MSHWAILAGRRHHILWAIRAGKPAHGFAKKGQPATPSLPQCPPSGQKP